MRAARLLVQRELRPSRSGRTAHRTERPARWPALGLGVCPASLQRPHRSPTPAVPASPLWVSLSPLLPAHTHTCPPSQHTHERGWPPPSSSDPSPRPEWGQVGREFAQKLLSGWSGCTGARGGAGGRGPGRDVRLCPQTACPCPDAFPCVFILTRLRAALGYGKRSSVHGGPRFPC